MGLTPSKISYLARPRRRGHKGPRRKKRVEQIIEYGVRIIPRSGQGFKNQLGFGLEEVFNIFNSFNYPKIVKESRIFSF
ncbi:MAG TPA: hypothetical protein DCK87_06780 [Desulfotomaculum sp.]|nr:hypothetical protein [Desulfotomaculum sp.]